MHKSQFDAHFELEENHWYFSARRAILLSMIQRFQLPDISSRILDIGCGTGFMLLELQVFGIVEGMEADSRAIEYALMRNPNLQIMKNSLPLDSSEEIATYNAITLFDVLEHIEEDQESLDSIYELLEPGGLLFLTVPAFMFLWSGHDVINHHKRRYRKREIKKLLNRSGFDIQKLSYFNFFLFPLVFLNRTVNRILRGSKPKSDLSMPNSFVNSILKSIFSFERHLLNRVNFPFGVSILAIARKPESRGD